MATPAKRRDIKHESRMERDNEDDDDDVEDEDDDDSVSSDDKNEEVQLDLEGYSPQRPDFDGIRRLLQQLFLRRRIDLSGLTNLIISQDNAGSVLKEVYRNAESLDDEEDSYLDIVFGVTTVINISARNKQNVTCIQQLRDLLKDLANEHATDATNTLMKNVLDNDAVQLGMLINERFINIPTQVSVPLFENLISEMEKAKDRLRLFNFSYYILICKLYKMKDKDDKKSSGNIRNGNSEPHIEWSNPEEEIFAEEADVSFEFSMEKETDNALSGAWTEKDSEMIPYRRVLLLDASKLQSIIDKIKLQIS